jgi:hypothetical protein
MSQREPPPPERTTTTIIVTGADRDHTIERLRGLGSVRNCA